MTGVLLSSLSAFGVVLSLSRGTIAARPIVLLDRH